MYHKDEGLLARALIDFLLTFPLPPQYNHILREQIVGNTFHVEQYCDCYKIIFEKRNESKTFPHWFPALLQGCLIIKDSGPISCQLFVENGYVVQFEVVDMGGNEIDWDYFGSNNAIFDIEYDLELIKQQLVMDKVYITNSCIGRTSILFEVDTQSGHHTVCLYGCTVRAFPMTGITHSYNLQINLGYQEEQQYTISSDDGEIDIVCALICLQDGLFVS